MLLHHQLLLHLPHTNLLHQLSKREICRIGPLLRGLRMLPWLAGATTRSNRNIQSYWRIAKIPRHLSAKRQGANSPKCHIRTTRQIGSKRNRQRATLLQFRQLSREQLCKCRYCCIQRAEKLPLHEAQRTASNDHSQI